jgi:hypothetical protein
VPDVDELDGAVAALLELDDPQPDMPIAVAAVSGMRANASTRLNEGWGISVSLLSWITDCAA